MKWVIMIVPVVLALLLGISLYVTVGERSWHICIDCHTVRTSETKFGRDSATYRTDARTAWHKRRFGPGHDHRWAWRGSTHHINMWGGANMMGCGRREPTAGPEWVPVLIRLEPLGLDLECNRELTHTNQERREEAIHSYQSWNEKTTDDEVRTWWKKTQDTLQRRRAN